MRRNGFENFLVYTIKCRSWMSWNGFENVWILSRRESFLKFQLFQSWSWGEGVTYITDLKMFDSWCKNVLFNLFIDRFGSASLIGKNREIIVTFNLFFCFDVVFFPSLERSTIRGIHFSSYHNIDHIFKALILT